MYSVVSMLLCDQLEYKAYITFHGSSHTSINWKMNSVKTDTTPTICPVAFMVSCTPIGRIATILFILDSGANCHISPECGNFKSLHPIPPITMKGFGGSSIQAIGMGTIEVVIASSLKLSLTNVLFVPDATIRLLSVSSLNHSGNYVTHFDASSCWVTNHSGATTIRGTLSCNCQLYGVSLASTSITHIPLSPSALYATQTPDVETWHRHLEHCNT
jgi:hypothetical protein